MFKTHDFISIDLKTASKLEIEAELKRLKYLSDVLKNEELAIKLILNCIYGAIANKWFVAHNPSVAEAITLQGQDLIKFSESILNRYFQEFWHVDKELHAKMGVTNVRKVSRPAVVYGDTDSNYVSFEDLYNSCDGFKGDGKLFIQQMYDLRIAEYLNKCFDKYAERFKTKNIQNFELETISETGIFLAKKKYILNLIWEDPIDIESLSSIKSRGIELAQSSTPIFARTKIKEFLKYIFTKKKTDFNLQEFVGMLKKCKEEFKLQNVDDISKGCSVNDYRKYILNDSTGFEVASKCPAHVRAAGIHNYQLNTSKWKGKYELIKGGDKIKYFYFKGNGDSCFGYVPGNFPVEFAPEVDYDLQFAKTIIDPMNRIIEVMGYNKIPPNLVTIRTLF